MDKLKERQTLRLLLFFSDAIKLKTNKSSHFGAKANTLPTTATTLPQILLFFTPYKSSPAFASETVTKLTTALDQDWVTENIITKFNLCSKLFFPTIHFIFGKAIYVYEMLIKF